MQVALESAGRRVSLGPSEEAVAEPRHPADDLHVEEYSGGNKRKLSLRIVMNGTPVVDADACARVDVPSTSSGDTVRAGNKGKTPEKPEVAETSKRRKRGSEAKRVAKPKFSIPLTKKEIEQEFIKMTGSAPPRKPAKKRPKKVQQQLDDVFPGLGLHSITRGKYRVRER